jgi:membrane protease YdiL (CAAX protease family)
MHALVRLVWNPTETRPRAGWRIALHLAAYLFAPPAAVWLLGDPLGRGLAPLFAAPPALGERIALILLRLFTVVAVTWLFAAYLDRRRWVDLGWQLDRHWWEDLGFGLLLGAVLMAIVFLIELAAGWVEITGYFVVGLADTPFAVAILGPITVFIVVGIIEELLCRGYQLRNLAEGYPNASTRPRQALLWGWAGSSALFGLLHIFNPHVTPLSIFYLMLTGGLFGLGYVLTGRLGLPIGLHITWNLVQANVFGFPVSGNVFDSATVIAIRQHGPEVWTGGAFGPEAGIVGLIALALGAWATVVWVRLRYGCVALDLSQAVYRPRLTPPL